MKLVSLLLFATVSAPSFVSCAASRPAEARVQTLVLSITGMTCAVDCPPRVRSALESVPGVDSVAVDYDTRSATVVCNEGTRVEALTAALLAQGFGGAPKATR